MAGTNRNRKLPLNEAWSHYWSVLFPDGVDWQTDLKWEVRKHLCFPGKTGVFSSAGELERELPSWAGDLAIECEDDTVAIKFKNSEFGAVPLFVAGNLQVLSNWQGSNPLDRVGAQSDLTDRDSKQCRELFRAVVRNCGNRIQNRLLLAIKEIGQPKFEIYCRPNGDVFAKEQRLPAFGLTEIARIEIKKNELQDRLGFPQYCHVHIQQRKPSRSKAGPRGSFHDQDAALIKEMKSLLDKNRVRSVRRAAFAVEPNALRRRNSSKDSVVRRLQDGFSKKYPDYLNRRGRMGS